MRSNDNIYIQHKTKNDDNSSTTTKRYSDNVFCLLYSDKHNLLDLYNALNNSSHTNIDELTITTLKGGVYMKYKNDASFVFSYELYMFEQQSTVNHNMPLRFLHYVSEVYRDLFSNSMLHRKSMVKLPTPHFITFYNGREHMTERIKILKLSDMFEHPVDFPELELEVTMINLNYDNSSDGTSDKVSDGIFDTQEMSVNSGLFTTNILDRCRSLKDYMTFVNKVRYKIDRLGMKVRLAVIEAVDECIKDDVLSDFFIKHRDEVIDVSIFEYDEEGVMDVMREEGREEGRAEMQAVIQKTIDNAMKKLGKSADEVMEILGITTDINNEFTSNISSPIENKRSDIFEYDKEGVMDVMREEGREEGRADATLKDIKNIMTKLNKSADEAMDILDVPIKERDALKTQL